jgi:hypothetical protein
MGRDVVRPTEASDERTAAVASDGTMSDAVAATTAARRVDGASASRGALGSESVTQLVSEKVLRVLHVAVHPHAANGRPH